MEMVIKFRVNFSFVYDIGINNKNINHWKGVNLFE